MFKTVYLIMLLLFTINVKAQFSKRHFEIETTITIEDSNSIKIFHLYQKDKPYKTRIERTYYWFSGKTIFATQGGYDKNLLHGDYKTLYKGKQLQSRGQFKKGLKTGEWTHWFINEIPAKTVEWSKGVHHGLETIYDSTGNVLSIKRFKKGEAQATVKTKTGLFFQKISPFKKRVKDKPGKEPKVKKEKKIKEKPKKDKVVKTKEEDKLKKNKKNEEAKS